MRVLVFVTYVVMYIYTYICNDTVSFTYEQTAKQLCSASSKLSDISYPHHCKLSVLTRLLPICLTSGLQPDVTTFKAGFFFTLLIKQLIIYIY